jgi:GNAT superfamily N-acetyltransferase
MAISYRPEPGLAVQEFREVLIASTLGERRPVDDLDRLERMLRHADLILTAREGTRLVGVARAITDFAYCCYLSDLAIDAAYQLQGIGKRLIAETHAKAGLSTTLLLISAPAAEACYPKIGMKHVPNCWAIPRSS